MIQKYLEEALNDHYFLELASSGQEALAKVEVFKPDIILLDIMLQDANGFDVCRKIRSGHSSEGIKIIFLSARLSLRDKMEGYDSGCDDYLTKPVEADELLAKLRVYSRLEHKKVHSRKINQLDEAQRGIFYEIKRKLKRISHIKADSPYCDICHFDGSHKSFRVRIPIKLLEELFLETDLVRVHRSYLVNVKYINALFYQDNNYEVLVSRNKQAPLAIPIGKQYRDNLKKRSPSLFMQ